MKSYPDPVFSLDAVTHTELALYTKIFNIHDIEHYLWIRVNPVIAKTYTLYEFDEVDLEKDISFDIETVCQHETGRIWYRFDSMLLNRDPGQHVYRMHMINVYNNDVTISLYFSYIVQREDTEKPHIYMKELSDGEDES